MDYDDRFTFEDEFLDDSIGEGDDDDDESSSSWRHNRPKQRIPNGITTDAVSTSNNDIATTSEESRPVVTMDHETGGPQKTPMDGELSPTSSTFWSASEDGDDEDRVLRTPNELSSENDSVAQAGRPSMEMMPPVEVTVDEKLPKKPPPTLEMVEMNGGEAPDITTTDPTETETANAITAPRPPPAQTFRTENSMLTYEDMEICQRLDDEYERALEEREVGWNSRYNSVRQSACFSLTFMFLYLLLGSTFFDKHTEWDLEDSLLFTIYTITTVGYGNHYIPRTNVFHLFTIMYIFVGIATLTIMVAQVYQCVALEATRAQYSRDKADIAKRGNSLIIKANGATTTTSSDPSSPTESQGSGFMATDGSSTQQLRSHSARVVSEFLSNHTDFRTASEMLLDNCVHGFEVSKVYLRDTQIGRGLSILLPLSFLVLIGAAVVGPIEGWTLVESIYFAVVSLTTVGFGDYYPTKKSAKWFCIFWLPFSIGFMSVYLGTVAHFYIHLSNQNIQRLERRLRLRMKRAKEAAERERTEARERAMRGQQFRDIEIGSQTESIREAPPSPSMMRAGNNKRRRPRRGQTFDSLGEEEEETTRVRGGLFGTPEAVVEVGMKRRERIIIDSSVGTLDGVPPEERPSGETMTTMKAVLRTVHANVNDADNVGEIPPPSEPGAPTTEAQFMSIKSSSLLESSLVQNRRTTDKKPSFALRVLVQERMAEIIAADIAGFQSHVDIKENTLSVTIDSLKSTADKWMIPRKARKAFRAVAFEALYFVGEHGLITKGSDALFELTPFEFHGLFGPLLASMGDADTMEGWLASTQILAGVDLKKQSHFPQSQKMEAVQEKHRMRSSVSHPKKTFTRTVQGNAFHKKHSN
eukprot:CAMPEP_0198306050 /NCGR_PEP_ID=MMETSP1449-20131203/58220_1 /TAXON_ID=420275 /ORGANISM="Attheya septentrionalis, Strain CCMP2084" /LENGTH=867 /DNA_ID=CAMNT_0044008595 /DNA_START=36 /DNA_END=2639 /DNA_ORIENTATION=-